MLVYAGIGSRKTPVNILNIMTQLAEKLANKGYTLRSGGANGADLAFENGAVDKEIYLPWKGFNGSKSHLHNITPEALELSSKYHKWWPNLKEPARKLMARNAYQVLGEDLKTPVKFVICWTPDGCHEARTRTQRTGGTGQAIEIADDNGIPVYNLAYKPHLDRVLAYLGDGND